MPAMPAMPATMLDVTDSHRALYEQQVASGAAVPWLFPQGVLGCALVMLFLLLPSHSRFNNTVTRYATFALATTHHVWVLLNCKSGASPGGLMIGMNYSWGIFIFAYVLIFNDPKRDFKRVETAVHLRFLEALGGATTEKMQQPQTGLVKVDKTSKGSSSSRTDAVNVSLHRQVNGKSSTLVETEVLSPTPAPIDSVQDMRYFWQPFPSEKSLVTRLDWVVDLMTSPRGVGWNFQTSWLPSLPAFVQRSLGKNDTATPADQQSPVKDTSVSRMGVARYDDKKQLLVLTLKRAVGYYLLLDLAKTIMSHDRFFYGDLDAAPPAYLPDIIRGSWILTRFYRTMLSGFSLQIIMRCHQTAPPLLLVGLLGPTIMGPRGEAWHFPDHWGFYRHVGDNGIGGYWGGYWHQAFRVVLQAFGHWFVAATGVPAKSALGQALVPIIVFWASGIMHACSSYTTIADSNPWSPFWFFMVQPFGVILEQAVCAGLGTIKPLRRLPLSVKRALNIVWLILWIWVTGPLLVNDIAKAGAWVTEPFFFVSPWRALGMGSQESGLVNGDYFLRVVPMWHTDPLGRWWLNGWRL